MHIVQRQTVDILVRDRAEADFWQDRMSMVCNDFFTEKLDDILSSHFSEFEKTSIDKLIIDLGIISKDQSPESIAQQYETALIHAISDYKKMHQNESQSSVDTEFSNSGIDFIIHYLKYGYLKWNVAERETLHETVREVITNFPEPFFRIILKESGNENMWRRLTQLIDNDIWDRITEFMFKSKNWTIDILLENLRLILAQSSNKYSRKLSLNSFQEYLKIFLIQYYAERTIKNSESTSWHSTLAKVWTSFNNIIFPSATVREVEEITTVFMTVFQFSKQDQKIWTTELSSIVKEDSFRPLKEEYSSNPRSSEDLDLYCDHTGAVILWPFLSGFFKSCGWIDETGIIFSNCLDKAIISIYYLCTGSFPKDETGLPMMKIVCGVSLEDSINLNSLPTKEELKKLDELLQNVTRNWSILKTEKVEALQVPFLQRFGAIKLTEYGWLINPEKNGIDILLQRLPWPISTIKFPWNDYLIQVDWA